MPKEVSLGLFQLVVNKTYPCPAHRSNLIYLKEHEGHYRTSGIPSASIGATQSSFLSCVCNVQALVLSIHELLHFQEK